MVMKLFNFTKNINTKLGTLAFVGLMIFPIINVQAGPVFWSTVAAGCVPEAASIGKVNSSAVYGTVSFRSTNTGRIRLTCPITGQFYDSNIPITEMAVNYYDPDGVNTGCRVKTYLLRANLNEHEGGNTIVSFDSNTSFHYTEPQSGKSFGTVDIPEGIDFNSNYYWIEVEINRSNTSCNPTAVGVYLTSKITL